MNAKGHEVVVDLAPEEVNSGRVTVTVIQLH